MEPELTRFESEQPNLKYKHVNVDERDQPKVQQLLEKYFQGGSIPHTVVLSPEDKVVLRWSGFKSYTEMVNEIAALEK